MSSRFKQRFLATEQRPVSEGRTTASTPNRREVEVIQLKRGEVARARSSRLGIEGESRTQAPPSDAFVVTRPTYALRSTALDCHVDRSNGELCYGGDEQIAVRAQDRGDLCRVVDKSRGRLGQEQSCER